MLMAHCTQKENTDGILEHGIQQADYTRSVIFRPPIHYSPSVYNTLQIDEERIDHLFPDRRNWCYHGDVVIFIKEYTDQLVRHKDAVHGISVTQRNQLRQRNGLLGLDTVSAEAYPLSAYMNKIADNDERAKNMWGARSGCRGAQVIYGRDIIPEEIVGYMLDGNYFANRKYRPGRMQDGQYVLDHIESSLQPCGRCGLTYRKYRTIEFNQAWGNTCKRRSCSRGPIRK